MVNKLPDTLYHYASKEGLHGIIEPKKIRATEIRHMRNDKSEFVYAINFTIQEIEQSGQHYFGEDRTILKEIVKRLKQIEQQVSDVDLFPLYVCCFSTEGDQPKLWKEYCPNGDGYSLGFNYEKLNSLAKHQGIALSRCLYEETEQRRSVSELLDATRRSYEDGIRSAANRRRRVQVGRELALPNFMTAFAHVAPTLKLPKFNDEVEWRLSAYSPPSAVLWRERNSKRIPYTEFFLTDPKAITDPHHGFPLSKIYVGPTQHKEQSKEYIEKFLQQCGIDCPVQNSEFEWHSVE